MAARNSPWFSSRSMTDALSRAVVCLAVAMVLSFVVRGVTASANQTLGRVWPFSLTRCQPASTPGCAAADQVMASSER